MNDYPTEEQLQAILDFQGSPREFIKYINSIWWHNGFEIKAAKDDFVSVKRCTLSTWGWSGNEEIIAVLKQTWFWMMWWRKSERGGHYTFEIPNDSFLKSLTSVEGIIGFGMPHSSIHSDQGIKHFVYAHFTGVTIDDKKFVYCPVGNICSWSEGDYDHKWCEWCKKGFEELKRA